MDREKLPEVVFRAIQVYVEACLERVSDKDAPYPQQEDDNAQAAILAALTAARAEATEKERERCARLCDAHAKEYADYNRRGSYEEGHFDAGCVLEEQIRQGEPQGSQEK